MGDISKIGKQPLTSPITPGGAAATPPPSQLDAAKLQSNVTGAANVEGTASSLRTATTNGLLVAKATGLGAKLSHAVISGQTSITLSSGSQVPLPQALNDFNRLIGLINKRTPSAHIPTSSLDTTGIEKSLTALSQLTERQMMQVGNGITALASQADSEHSTVEPLLNATASVLSSKGAVANSKAFSGGVHVMMLAEDPKTQSTFLQNQLSKLQAMSTNELMSIFLMTNINNMKDLVVMLTNASLALTKYVSACNDHMAQITQAHGTVLSNGNDEISNSQTNTFVVAMANLGFPSISKTSDGNMNAQTISGNLTTISNGVQLATQKSNQLSTELSQANQMLQQWLKFASNTLQGNSRMVSSIYSNF